MRKRPSLFTVLFAAGCAYESFAVVTGLVPTLTELTWKYRHNRYLRVGVFGLIGEGGYHLIFESET